MKVWVLAGLFSLASAPAAFALDVASDAECQVDDMRRQMDQVITGADSGSTPNTAAPTVAPAARPPTTQRQVAAATPTDRAQAARRRSGKRIPDAQLIGPRGAL
jgi:hypothetical protein